MTHWQEMHVRKGDLMDKAETRMAIRQAVIAEMQVSDIPDISITRLCARAKVSRSTFYRYYDSVDDVVKQTEDELIDSLRRASRFDSTTMACGDFGVLNASAGDLARAEILYEARDFIVAVTGIHGDPSFATKAANLIFENVRQVMGPYIDKAPNSDFVYEFFKAGLFSMVSHWLNRRPDLTPDEMHDVIKDFYANMRKMI